MDIDWFERLVGFRERPYDETREQLHVEGTRLQSRINGKSYAIGRLETPQLGQLRRQAHQACAELRAGPLRVSNVRGDVRAMHADPANHGAMFQVASQFNLLEMVSPGVTPECGVTCYQSDHTQGPACAIAAGAATLYRNYFAPVKGEFGQRADRQIDCLEDVGTALGNEDGLLWEMRNGYLLCDAEGLTRVNDRLARTDRDELRQRLRIGLHWDVEATEATSPAQRISQAFCSALPVSYNRLRTEGENWQPFASLILEAAYEATLCASAVNAAAHGSKVVYLTLLGGGAFGNERPWILAALRRALSIFAEVDLDVRIVSHSQVQSDLEGLATR